MTTRRETGGEVASHCSFSPLLNYTHLEVLMKPLPPASNAGAQSESLPFAWRDGYCLESRSEMMIFQ